MNESVINVVGIGRVHVVPDVTRLEIRIERVFKTYNDAYANAKENSTWVVKILEYNKLPGTLAKTIRMDISEHKESQYEDGSYIGTKKDGYELNQFVKIDLGIDNVMVNNIVRGVGKFIKGAQINIGYTQKNPRPTQLKILERAVKDAQEKADVMAKAVGCNLGKVKSIKYGDMQISVYSQAREIHCCEEALVSTPDSLDITPDDLAVSDEVHVIWELV